MVSFHRDICKRKKLRGVICTANSVVSLNPGVKYHWHPGIKNDLCNLAKVLTPTKKLRRQFLEMLVNVISWFKLIESHDSWFMILKHYYEEVQGFKDISRKILNIFSFWILRVNDTSESGSDLSGWPCWVQLHDCIDTAESDSVMSLTPVMHP